MQLTDENAQDQEKKKKTPCCVCVFNWAEGKMTADVFKIAEMKSHYLNDSLKDN